MPCLGVNALSSSVASLFELDENLRVADWKRILVGSMEKMGWEIFRSICNQLSSVTAPAGDLALFWSAVASAEADSRAFEMVDSLASAFAAEIERGLLGAYRVRQRGIELFGGFTGAAWIANDIYESHELTAAVDDRLLGLLAAHHWDLDFDLVNGLVGMGVYFLSRGELGLKGLTHVAAHLCRLATIDHEGAKWYKSSNLMPPLHVSFGLEGYHNCGLAHGSAGVVALLGRLESTSIWNAELGQLRDAAVMWLAAQYESDIGFPPWVPKDGRRKDLNSSWCSGDAGITSALFYTECSYPDTLPGLSQMIERWMELPSRVVNVPGFCHGAAGTAHVANRIFQVTGSEKHLEASRRWLQTVMSFWHGDAVVLNLGPEESRFDLLNGLVGIGLVLLSALTDQTPQWDRLVLCDLPSDENT